MKTKCTKKSCRRSGIINKNGKTLIEVKRFTRNATETTTTEQNRA